MFSYNLKELRKGLSFIELLFVSEAFFGGFYVAITRMITPIYIVRIGFKLHTLLLINAFGGLLALLLALILYNMPRMTVTKHKLVLALTIERILWFSIYFVSDNLLLLWIIYGFAIASPLLTSIFMNMSMFSLFSEDRYRKVISLRGALGGSANLLAQFIVVIVLMVYNVMEKYLYLYIIAFIVSIVSPILMLLIPHIPRIAREEIRPPEEIEAKASTIFLLITMYFAAVSILNLAWIPYLLNIYHMPDYYVALIGFTQTLTAIFSSIYWANREYKRYRAAFIFLSMIPILVFLTPIPLLHLLYASILSFSAVGANFYASFAYSSLIRKLGVYKAGVLLPSASYLALTFGGVIGLLIGMNYLYVFLSASIFGLMGLFIALTSIPEFSIVKTQYVRLYSRIIYLSALFSYSLIFYSLKGTAKLVLKTSALLFALLILFLLYRMIYYVVVLSGG
jgi:MFS family permease